MTGIVPRRRAETLLSATIIAALPVLLAGNALWLMLHGWLVDLQYALPGFPDDGLGLTDAQREALGVAGIRSVRPFDEGMQLLREARLPDGSRAFEEREISHMRDVRDLIGVLAVAWAVAAAAVLGAVLGLRRLGRRMAIRRALRRGCALTAGLIVAIALLALADFESFFAGFHALFFEGRSWRFSDTYTLRHIYPDAFWAVAVGVLGALIALQGGALALLWRLRDRRGGR